MKYIHVYIKVLTAINQLHLHLHVPVHALQSMLTVDNKDTCTYIIIIINLYMEWIIAIRIVRHMNIRMYLTNKENKNISQNM